MLKKSKEFQAAEGVDAFIEKINAVVASGEAGSTETVAREQWPILFIVAPPRSGTTLFTQWLTHIGFATPLNITARFYKNPYTAGLLQRLLTDSSLHYRNELDCGVVDSFQSLYGKTSGVLSAHEFSHYFRRFFPVSGQWISDKELEQSKIDEFVDGLNLFTTALQKPLVLKGFLIQYNFDSLIDHENIYFVHCHRYEIDNVCSLVGHRKTLTGDINNWVSVKPPGFELIKDLDPYQQLAAQVAISNAYLAAKLEKVPSERKINVPHEQFCKSPKSFASEISNALSSRGYQALEPYTGPGGFDINRYDQNSAEYSKASEALKQVRPVVTQVLKQYLNG
ncbi:MAG: hypothetical protein AB8B63_01820 [Granulosicoccus sp.]